MKANMNDRTTILAKIALAALVGVGAFLLMAASGLTPTGHQGEVAFGAPGSQGPVVRLTGAMPDPQVRGRTYPRSGVISGLQFLDFEGNEMGGLGTIAEERRGMVLCFDHETAEAVCLTRLGPDVSFSIMEPPAADAEVGRPGPQRLSLGVDAGDGLAYLHLLDRAGNVRLRLQVDSSGTPVIETIGPDGEVEFSTNSP